jgi:hypothetical protein
MHCGTAPKIVAMACRSFADNPDTAAEILGS